MRVRVGLGGVGQVTEQVLGAELVDQAGEGVVVLVAIVDDHHAVQVRQHEGGERLQAAVAEEVIGQQPGAGDQQVTLAGLRPGPHPDRGLISAHHVRQDDQRPDRLVRHRHRGGRPGDHAVHEPGRGLRAGQRLDQLGAAVHRDRVRHHEEHAPCLQVRAVADRARRGARRRCGPVDPAAPAGHRVQVMLDHLSAGQRDLHLLARCCHPEILAIGQRRPALARPGREMRDGLIRVPAPGQVMPRCPRLLARLAPPRLPPRLLRRRAARLIVHRRRE